MSDVLERGDAPERCPDCFHTISLEGLNDPDCECYCHKMRDELEDWLFIIEGRRDWHE